MAKNQIDDVDSETEISISEDTSSKESKKEFEKLIQDIETKKMYVRSNGVIRIPRKEDWLRLRNAKTYRTTCSEDWTIFFDFDADDARPFFKDLLNRQWQFLEVKLLWFILFCLFVWFFLFWLQFFTTPSQTYFEKKFSEIKINTEAPKPTMWTAPTLIPWNSQNVRDILNVQ